MNSATMTVNGVELTVQCLLVQTGRDELEQSVARQPVVADLKSWDPAEVEAQANAIATQFGCRSGSLDDAKWCLGKLDSAARVYRTAKTASQRDRDQRGVRRAARRGELS